MSSYPQGFQTIDELLQHIYGRTPGEIRKDAGGLDSSTTGIYNPVYGGMIWANFNLEANIFSCLPKYVWNRSGWRIFTEKSGDIADKGSSNIDGVTIAANEVTNNTVLGGTVEGGLVPDPIRPIVKQVSVRPKTLVYPFQVSEIQEHLTTITQDDHWGHMGQQRVYASAQYKENINKQALLNVANIDTEAKDVLSRLNMESLDRIISSNGEHLISDRKVETGTSDTRSKYNPWITVAGTPAATTTANANLNQHSDLADDAGIDRTETTYDTTVFSPSGTLNTSDTLTDGTIRDFLSDIRPTGGKDPSVFYGGHKTYSEIQGLYVRSIRIQNPSDMNTTVTVGVNGINTFKGNGVGIHISKLYDIPFIPSKDVPGARDNPHYSGASAKTNEVRKTGSIGNLYALDTSDPEGAGIPRFGIRVLKPPVYYEASPRIPGFPYITGGFIEKGIFESIMELTCTQLKTQGKIRDIKRS